MKMNIRQIITVIFIEQFKEIAKTKAGISIWQGKILVQDDAVKTQLTDIKYYGHHPPDVLIKKTKYRIDVRYGSDEIVLVNDTKKTGPVLCVEVDRSNTNGSNGPTESNGPDKDLPIYKRKPKFKVVPHSPDVEKLINEFRQNPTLKKCTLIESAMFQNGFIDKLSGYNDPLQLMNYLPELEEYFAKIPIEQVLDRIGTQTLEIKKGAHPNSKYDNAQKRNFERMSRGIVALKAFQRWLANYNEIDITIGTDDQSEEDNMSPEEVGKAIEEKNKKLAAQPDDLTQINHVGPKTAEKLQNAGFTKISHIADPTNFKEIKEITGKTTAEKISDAAIELISKSKQRNQKMEDKVKEINKINNKITVSPGRCNSCLHLDKLSLTKDELQKNLITDESVDRKFMMHDFKHKEHLRRILIDEDGSIIHDTIIEICDDCREDCGSQKCPNCKDMTHPGCWSPEKIAKYCGAYYDDTKDFIDNPEGDQTYKDAIQDIVNDLERAVTRSLTRIDGLNYVPGFRQYRASWSSTSPRKIILLKQWPRWLNKEQRQRREEIIFENGRYQLSGAKIGTIVHEHVEFSKQFERNLLDEGWKLVEKEQKVSIPVEHPDGGQIELVGHVDAIYRHQRTGQRLVVDYKTRKSEVILKLWNGVTDRTTQQFYPAKVNDNFKQLIVYQKWAGELPGVLIEVGRNKGEVHKQWQLFDEELWEKQKRFWFDIATIETEGRLPGRCAPRPNGFPCSWGEGKSRQKCEFFGFCWEDDN